MKSSDVATFLDQPIATWIDLLQQADPLLRRQAAYALGMLGPAAREAGPVLTAALDDDVHFVRVWAAAALAQIDRKRSKAAVAALVAGLKEPEYFVRSLAAWHLGRLGLELPGTRAAIPKLKALLADKDPSVRREASDALKRFASRNATGLSAK